MKTRVTAVIVARQGGEHLARTLDALSKQTRKPDVKLNPIFK
jgi:GT2 family glycosyltransferase